MSNEKPRRNDDDGDVERDMDIGAIIGLIDYLMPEAQYVSPSVALHLHLARYELNLLRQLKRDLSH